LSAEACEGARQDSKFIEMIITKLDAFILIERLLPLFSHFKTAICLHRHHWATCPTVKSDRISRANVNVIPNVLNTSSQIWVLDEVFRDNLNPPSRLFASKATEDATAYSWLSLIFDPLFESDIKNLQEPFFGQRRALDVFDCPNLLC
jgi:hypothetical protein